MKYRDCEVLTNNEQELIIRIKYVRQFSIIKENIIINVLNNETERLEFLTFEKEKYKLTDFIKLAHWIELRFIKKEK